MIGPLRDDINVHKVNGNGHGVIHATTYRSGE